MHIYRLTSSDPMIMEAIRRFYERSWPELYDGTPVAAATDHTITITSTAVSNVAPSPRMNRHKRRVEASQCRHSR